MRILITGANGFLGYHLTQLLLGKGNNIFATGRGADRLQLKGEDYNYVPMDFTDPFHVHDVFTTLAPDVVVHAGAVSKPDDCEKDQWQAYITNVEGTLNLLANAEEQKTFFIFLSTDFIFDGEKGMYSEEDAAHPVNYYGKTKLEAEEAVMEYPLSWAIVRTVLVYGQPHTERGNLLTVVREKLEKGEYYQVFNDQVRTPTYVGDLAKGIEQIMEKRATGVWHLSGEDVLTPFDMAIQLADYLSLNAKLLKPVTASELVQPARRPLKTGFNINKAKNELSFQPVSFKEGLQLTFPK